MAAGETMKLDPQEWNEIAKLYVEGMTLKEIAKQYPISIAAISRRASKEGWSTQKRINGVKKRVLRPKRLLGRRVGTEKATNIRKHLQTGISRELAARIEGFTPQELDEWMAMKPEIARDFEQAEAEPLAKQEQSVQRAGEQSWKAAVVKLERHRYTRDHWAAPQAAKTDGGPSIVVQFNWQRDEPPGIPDVVIDHEPEQPD